MEKNIFAGTGLKTRFVNLIYEELMKRQYVSYADILTLFYNKEKNYYDLHAPSKEKGFGELKKAFPLVIKTLLSIDSSCVKDNGKSGKGKAFIYTGVNDDPLRKEREAVAQKSMEDYVAFRKLYHEWWSMDQKLTNINLLPFLNQAITEHKVLKFQYKPYSMDAYWLVMHPQFLKEYNGRWYVLGRADREPYEGHNVAIDRIVGEIEEVKGVKYISAAKDYYQHLFSKVVGVTNENNAEVETVLLRTHNIYVHGLIATKPFHESQREVVKFGMYEGVKFGEFALRVVPNRELQGKVLTFGGAIEVVSPHDFREKIKEELAKAQKLYTD